MMQNVASESRPQNESTTAGTDTIIHAPGTFFLQFRQDFVALCATCGYTKSTETKKSRSSPWCKAFILSIIEQFAPSKNGGPVTMTLGQWMERMYGIFGRNAIIDSLDELVGETLIRRKAYKAKTGEVYGYWLNYSLINERLAILGDQLKMKPSSLEGVENETGVVSNETGGSFKFNLEGLKMKHIVYSNVYSNLDSEKKVSSVSADAENATPSPAFSSESSESKETPWDDQDEEDQQETLQTLQAAGIVPTQPDQPQEAGTHPIATETPSPDSLSTNEMISATEPASQAVPKRVEAGTPAHDDQVPPPAKKPAKPRGARQPRAVKKTTTPEMQSRIDAVFACFDEVAREVTNDPEFTHARYQTSAEEIRALLEGRTITPDMLKAVYLELWNKPAGTDGFTWKDHMSIKAVCRNFDTTWTAIKARQAKKAKRQMPPDNVLPFPKPEEASSPRILTRSEREAILHPQGRVGAR